MRELAVFIEPDFFRLLLVRNLAVQSFQLAAPAVILPARDRSRKILKNIESARANSLLRG